MKNQKKSGISLIVLVITIIVIVILAVAVILSIANNNPIENANKAKFQNDLKSMQEEINLYTTKQYAENRGVYIPITIEGEYMKNLFPSTEKYKDIVKVVSGKLCYIGDNEKEKEWASEIGIEQYVSGTKIESAIVNNVETNLNFNEDNTVIRGNYSAKDGSSELPNEIIIQEGITEIGSASTSASSDDHGVFTSTVEIVHLPSTLTKIGNMAFYNNKALKEVEIPKSVTAIGTLSFSGCTNLDLTIPDNVTSVGFDALSSIKSVTFEGGIFKTPTIPEFASLFYGTGLETVTGKITIKGTSITKESLEEYKAGLENNVYESNTYCNVGKFEGWLEKIDNGTLVLLSE